MEREEPESGRLFNFADKYVASLDGPGELKSAWQGRRASVAIERLASSLTRGLSLEWLVSGRKRLGRRG